MSRLKFGGKYRIQSTRLKNYDYSSEEAYFIIFCTKDREHFFGEIINEKLQNTEQSKICQTCWLGLPNHYPNYVLDSFVIMPNHVHGILMISNAAHYCKYTVRDAGMVRDAINRVSTGGITQNNNPMLHQNLSTIIRWYKGRTTFELRKINPKFAWQSRFYDHIIRNDNELDSVREYILNNPVNWEKDQNNITDF